MEPEALARLEAQLRQQFRATDPEFLAQAAELKKAHDREAQAQFSNDLKTIRAAYPDEKAQKAPGSDVVEYYDAGEGVLEVLARQGATTPAVTLGIPDRFIGQGPVPQLFADLGLNAEGIAATVREQLKMKKRSGVDEMIELAKKHAGNPMADLTDREIRDFNESRYE